MLSRKIKTFFRTNKLRLIVILLHRTFLSIYIKNILKLKNATLVRARNNYAGKIKLNSKEIGALNSLMEDGYVNVSDFFRMEDLIKLEEKTNELDNKTSKIDNSSYHKKFWSRMTDADEQNKNIDNIVNKIALNDSVLKVLLGYFSTPAFMDYSILTKSVFSDEKFQISQLWHQDKDDVEMAKLFIYLNDVTEHNGPFTLLDLSSSKKIPTFFLRNHIDDSFIYKYAAPSEVKKFTGKKFSAFIVDTSKCFHMGSRITKQGEYRFMLTAAFITLPSIYPWQVTNKYSSSASLEPLEFLATHQLP